MEQGRRREGHRGRVAALVRPTQSSRPNKHNAGSGMGPDSAWSVSGMCTRARNRGAHPDVGHA